VIGEASNYDALLAALRARAEELNIARNTLDEIAGLPIDYTGKLLSGKSKKIGPISLFPLLGALGLSIALIEDPALMVRVDRAPKRNAGAIGRSIGGMRGR
jgi:hypothetical protein